MVLFRWLYSHIPAIRGDTNLLLYRPETATMLGALALNNCTNPESLSNSLAKQIQYLYQIF